MFMGFHGRKGPKKDVTVMGSTLKAMTWNIKCPTFIVNFKTFKLIVKE